MFLNLIATFFSTIWNGSFFHFLVTLADLTLVYFFAYKFFLLIKGTRSAQILFGFFILFIIYLLSTILGLHATEWLLNSFFQYAIILIVIIFNEEIRSVLSSFDLFELFRGSTSKIKDTMMVDEISEALSHLASIKEGALLIIARKGDPTPFITGGVEINASIKKELILSLFFKNSPLHDGAVIINNGKIKIAGAVLPLSTNPNIDPNFGTRHRAGYGISEQVDCFVFVVSEERGQISMLHNGKITRHLTKEMINKILIKNLEKK
jgi:uncharacterized protein (TIGR00159 family)